MSQNRGNSKIKINAIPTNDKHNLKKEINDKKLLINNEKYLKDYLSVGIKINSVEYIYNYPFFFFFYYIILKLYQSIWEAVARHTLKISKSKRQKR